MNEGSNLDTSDTEQGPTPVSRIRDLMTKKNTDKKEDKIVEAHRYGGHTRKGICIGGLQTQEEVVLKTDKKTLKLYSNIFKYLFTK